MKLLENVLGTTVYGSDKGRTFNIQYNLYNDCAKECMVLLSSELLQISKYKTKLFQHVFSF